jgi:hypothetical protein
MYIKQKASDLDILFVAQVEPHLKSLGDIVGCGFPFLRTSINLKLPGACGPRLA